MTYKCPSNQQIYLIPCFVKENFAHNLITVFFITGSRDGCLGVWDTRCELNFDKSSDCEVLKKEPVRWLTSIHEDERFRAIQYNPVSNVCTLLLL